MERICNRDYLKHYITYNKGLDVLLEYLKRMSRTLMSGFSIQVRYLLLHAESPFLSLLGSAYD